MSLVDLVPRLAPDTTSWRPRLFASDSAELAKLLDDGHVVFVHDEIRRQLAELCEVHAPERRLTEAELDERIATHVASCPLEAYGSWVYYPWSRRLVHVLPREEFVFLRTSANRNRITQAEQDQLARLTIGVAGLSVGQMTAITLALEGIGGRFRLADFDTLGLTNLNRLRAGVEQIELNKAILTARAIYELNPYAEVELFLDGVTAENVDAFLGGLDLVYEECDDLHAKFLLRLRAKEMRIPVVMETSDRGLIDVERFDQHPEAPPFHGLTRPVEASRLKGLTSYEKIPMVYEIIGRTLSKRLSASFVDVETTLKTWPQLASAVALGGALNADVGRRIALGTLRESGRFFVDMEALVADGKSAPIAPPLDDDDLTGSGEPELPPPAKAPAEISRMTRMSPEVARDLVTYGTLAPSGGNCQPWRFHFRDGTLHCIHDIERSRSMLDFGNAASHLAFGAMARHMELAAAAMGLSANVVPFPDAGAICTVETTRADESGEAHELSPWLTKRATNRRHGERVPFDAAHRAALEGAAASAGARLQFVEGPAMQELGAILGAGDRVRFLSPVMHKEMMGELRWDRAEADRTRDGIELATLELTPTDRIGMRMAKDPGVMKVLRETGAGHGLGRSAIKTIGASSAVGLLTIEGRGARAFFDGGRALADVWLRATALGLAVQPMTALLYMFARAAAGGEGLSDDERAELARLRARFDQLFRIVSSESELILFRVAYAGPPSARSLRRRALDVLTFG
jgi:nitroreductase